ncbi:MAG: substrate-binding domain-containing protein [Alphaproteobacteria bacterium]|nr:substrate-binding domain-containing protein [Alphaproteobacteria bacterium]
MRSIDRRHALSAAALALGAGTTLRASSALAQAPDLTIYSGGAVKSALVVVAERFQAATGARLALEFHPMGPLTRRLREGATPDIVVLTREVMDEIATTTLVRADGATEVGRVAIGVAVHESAPAPDISTPEAFKATLLAAKSLVYIDPERGTSGRHFAAVLQTLGIAEAMKPKTRLGDGGYVVEPVGRGEVEIGVHQITEILPVKGVRLVGPLPAALQKETIYVAALTQGAKDPARARDFLAFLRAPATRTIFAARGFIE